MNKFKKLWYSVSCFSRLCTPHEMIELAPLVESWNIRGLEVTTEKLETVKNLCQKYHDHCKREYVDRVENYDRLMEYSFMTKLIDIPDTNAVPLSALEEISAVFKTVIKTAVQATSEVVGRKYALSSYLVDYLNFIIQHSELEPSTNKRKWTLSNQKFLELFDQLIRTRRITNPLYTFTFHPPKLISVYDQSVEIIKIILTYLEENNFDQHFLEDETKRSKFFEFLQILLSTRVSSTALEVSELEFDEDD